MAEFGQLEFAYKELGGKPMAQEDASKGADKSKAKRSRRRARKVSMQELERDKYKAVKRKRKAKPTEAKEKFFSDLEAAERERMEAMAVVAGIDEMSPDEAMEAVKRIMPRTGANVRIVAAGNAIGEDVALELDAKRNVVAEDADVAATQVRSMQGVLRAREADLYQLYAKINPRILKHYASRGFIGYPACTILGQDEIIGLCCAMPPEDAIAPGFKLRCASIHHKKDDKHIVGEAEFLEQMENLLEDSEISKMCIKYGTYKRLYGIGIAVPICKLKGGHTFEEPYDPSLIEEDSFKGFNIIDPSKIAWDYDANTLYNPLSEWYQKPEYLRFTAMLGEGGESLGDSERMHRSWLYTTNYREVGEDLLATYQYGGQPLPQLLYERTFCANKMGNEIVALAMSKRTVVLEGNLKAMIQNTGNTNRMIERWNFYRNNHSLAFQETGTNIKQLETSLADLQPLASFEFQLVASLAGIPITKLFKNVPSGLQATGQYQEEDYAQTVKPIRKDDVNLINKWCEMYIASAYPGRNDLQLRCELNPFIEPKAEKVQQIASGTASMVCQLVQNNIVDITEARAILRTGCDSFHILSPKLPEIIKKIEDMKDPEKQAQMQAQMQGGGGMPGMPEGMAGGQGEETQENPILSENKNVFQEALNAVLNGGGEEGGNIEEPPAEGEEEQAAEPSGGEVEEHPDNGQEAQAEQKANVSDDGSEQEGETQKPQ